MDAQADVHRVDRKVNQVESSHASDQGTSGFVVNGRRNACVAAEAQVRADVESEYASQLATASIFVRWRLRWEIRKEIVKRINKIAPREAVY